MMTDNMTTLTDEQLYRLCKKYGATALEARRRFAGLLPEVYKRRLYERRGFASIYEFAAKLAGMSHEQVQRVLQLERKFEDKPALKQALVSGEVSVHKLTRVASIATTENEKELARKAQLLSNRALETLVRDEKSVLEHAMSAKHESDLTFGPQVRRSVHVHSNPQESLPDVNLLEHLSPELQKNLIERLEKGININELLTELLQKHDLELAQEKEKLAAETTLTNSRYIKVAVRRHIRKEHGIRCSIRNCGRAAEHIHHTQRFALARAHDPRYLAPLCKEHHEIAHTIDLKYHHARTS